MRDWRKISIASLLGAVACIGSSTLAQTATPRPALTNEQAIQLFEEAGFSVASGRPVNRCGGPSNPRIAFVDLNGDGRAEVHLADVDPRCYRKPGAYFAIMAQQPDGSWKRLIAEDGIVGFDAARTSGWNNLLLADPDSACPGVRRFAGTDYGPPNRCSPFAANELTAASPPSPLGMAGIPISQTKLFDWTEDQTSEARNLPALERAAIFQAAGVQAVGGGRWTSCTDDASGRSEAQLAMIEDINGDGRPEAMIRDSGSYCNGYAGVASSVLTQTSTGAWSVMLSTQGFINFLESRGADNYPDIEVSLPGFCFPYRRWDGSEYAIAARLDREGKPCQPG